MWGDELRSVRSEELCLGHVLLLDHDKLLGGLGQFRLDLVDLLIQLLGVFLAPLYLGSLLALNEFDELELEPDQMVLESRVAHRWFFARCGPG